MNKFNKAQRNVQRERRARRSERRRSAHPALKISTKSNEHKPPGKKLRKLERKWRKSQKEAIASGLVTMEDIQMIAFEKDSGFGIALGSGASETNSEATEPRGVNVKKRIKLLKKKTRSSRPAAAEASKVEMEE